MVEGACDDGFLASIIVLEVAEKCCVLKVEVNLRDGGREAFVAEAEKSETAARVALCNPLPLVSEKRLTLLAMLIRFGVAP